MKRFFSLLMFCAVLSGSLYAEQLPAFPGAEGFGKYAVGGRYGSVYHVTNLNDSGTGSLRDAVSVANRIIVFDVSGVIRLNSRLVFKNNLYVAGQTAPGEGITVYGNGVSFSGANNTIVRYVRFRMGSGGDSGKDAAGVANGTTMIFDHLSVSWGLDETFSISSDGKGALGDITIQNSIISQGLMTHSAGGLIQADNITLYRNLYVDNSTRNNKIKGRNQYVNNIVYNWKNGCYIMGGDSEGQSYCNATSNLFINGPSVGGNAFTGGNGNFHLYAADNWQDKNRDGEFNPYSIPASEYSGLTGLLSTPYDYPSLPAYPGKTLIDSLLPDVGASLPYRDPVDYYVINEVRSFGKEGALISREAELPIGIPTEWPHTLFEKPLDSDGDGMPDAWEQANGTNPSVDDAMTIAANGYANIENYINSLCRDNRPDFLRQPFVLSVTESTPNSLTINWFDYTENEDGFVVEQQIDGVYQEVARIPAADYRLKQTDGTPAGAEMGNRTGTVKCVIKKLLPATAYSFRVRAFKNDGEAERYSAYSSVLTSKTQPEYVPMVAWDDYEPDLTWNMGSGAWNFTNQLWNGQVYADEKKVLLVPSESAQINIETDVAPNTVVVGGDNDLQFSGAAIIGEATSVNKFGKGTLDMGDALHHYTGATALHEGVMRFATLKNGGEASGIGSSQEFAQNWIWDGGCWEYTGGNTSTNRSALLYQPTTFYATKGAKVTMSGQFEGQGGLTVKGGEIVVANPSFFSYTGDTRLEEGGSIYLSTTEISKAGIGQSPRLVMAGGTLRTKGESSNYETYSFPIVVEEGSYSYLVPNRNCSINNVVSGGGTLEFQVPYLREYVGKSWDAFTGKLVANGVSTEDCQLLLYNGKGIPNASIELKGKIRVVCWKASSTYYLGGLSGPAGTYLSCASKNTKGAQMTWIVGGANTDETFNGVIDNRCSAGGYNGVTNIRKIGVGDWRLNGKNVHAGTTAVEQGRLIVNGSLEGTGAVSVSNGATLCGKGSVKGMVTVNNGGRIMVGDTLFNQKDVFTLNGSLQLLEGGIIEVALSRKQILNNASKIKFNANSSLKGTLKLDMTEVAIDIPNNSSFQIFDIASTAKLTGQLAAIQPERPSEDQEWDVSELFETGKIYVRKSGYTALPKLEAEAVCEQYYTLDGKWIGRERPTIGDDQLLIVRRQLPNGGFTTEKVRIR